MNREEHIRITEETFVQAYETYWKDLYTACCHYVDDTALAKEIVQELFISLWEKRERLEVTTSIQTYLFSALKYKVLEHFRKQAVREQYIQYKQHTADHSEQHGPDEQLSFNELRTLLHQIVQSLPERSREVYRLSREEGMSNRSIAKALLISEKSVEGNMTRALGFIRRKLKGLLDR